MKNNIMPILEKYRSGELSVEVTLPKVEIVKQKRKSEERKPDKKPMKPLPDFKFRK